MKKTALSLVLLGSCFASSAFAFTIIHPLEKVRKPVSVKPATKAVVKSDSYTNFSGQWTGTCNFDGFEDDDTVNIDHGVPNTIEINGQFYELDGSVQTEMNTNQEHSYFDHLTLNWNRTNTVILLKATGVFVNHNQTANMDTDSVNGTLSIVNGQLIAEGSMSLSSSAVIHHYKCTYNKQM